MEPIKRVIKQVVGNLSRGGQQAGLNSRISVAWEASIGRKLAKHTKIAGFKDGKLLVIVDSPTFLFYLNLKRAKIRTHMQKITNQFEDISLKIGRL